MAVDKTPEFLWQLFCLHLMHAPNEVLDKHLSTMYDEPVNLNGSFETLVDGYALNHDRKFLDLAIIEAVKQRYFNTQRHVQLVAAEVGKGLISLDFGSALLMVPKLDMEELSKSVEHALDVAWLINQDKQDGFMRADEDGLLTDALANVTVDFQKSMCIANQQGQA